MELAALHLHLDKVVVHPLVLLSVVDHFSQMGKIGNQKRVLAGKLPMNHKITYSC